MADDAFKVVVSGDGSSFAQHIVAGGHPLLSDEPAAAGGTDSGPDPYGLLLASLGACTSMTIGMYARRKKWPVERITVRLRHSRVHAEDCADCEKGRLLDRIERVIELAGPLSAEQRQQLLAIAEKCPVHRTLTSKIDIQTSLAGPS
jgi:putative redox protein